MVSKQPHKSFLSDEYIRGSFQGDPWNQEFRSRGNVGIHAVYEVFPEKIDDLTALKIWDELNWPLEQQQAVKEFVNELAQQPTWSCKELSERMERRAIEQRWPRDKFHPMDCRDEIFGRPAYGYDGIMLLLEKERPYQPEGLPQLLQVSQAMPPDPPRGQLAPAGLEIGQTPGEGVEAWGPNWEQNYQY